MLDTPSIPSETVETEKPAQGEEREHDHDHRHETELECALEASRSLVIIHRR